MLDGRILRRMSLDLHEIKFHLQGCITEEANQVRLGRYLKGHQIQYDYPKGGGYPAPTHARKSREKKISTASSRRTALIHKERGASGSCTTLQSLVQWVTTALTFCLAVYVLYPCLYPVLVVDA